MEVVIVDGDMVYVVAVVDVAGVAVVVDEFFFVFFI